MKTILLTGATGFLGSHLLRAIINEGCYNVVVLKRSFSNVYRIKDLLLNPSVAFFDIDKISIEEVFKQNTIDVIVHTANEYGRDKHSCKKVLETNLIFPIDLLDNAVEYNVEAFINTDSYFNKENLSYSFLATYSLSKKSLLLWLNAFSKKIKIVNVVLEHIYGRNDNPDKFVEKMIRDIAINNKAKVDLTPGEQQRDFIYADDVADAYLKVVSYSLNNCFRFKSFDLGTAKTTRIKDFVGLIKTISNSNSELDFTAIPYRNDEIMYSCADIVDLMSIGWEPKTSINEGIRNIIDEYRGANTL